jgi:hypothetical protein
MRYIPTDPTGSRDLVSRLPGSGFRAVPAHLLDASRSGIERAGEERHLLRFAPCRSARFASAASYRDSRPVSPVGVTQSAPRAPFLILTGRLNRPDLRRVVPVKPMREPHHGAIEHPIHLRFHHAARLACNTLRRRSLLSIVQPSQSTVSRVCGEPQRGHSPFPTLRSYQARFAALRSGYNRCRPRWPSGAPQGQVRAIALTPTQSVPIATTHSSNGRGRIP